MYKKLYDKINEATCFITVFLGEERISSGTGFCFRADGQVITAAHVVTGRFPIRYEDYSDPNVRIYAKFKGIPVLEYKVGFCSVTIEVKSFKSPIQIDVALLTPKVALTHELNNLPAKIEPPKLGEEVFLAGFSDELKLPFLVDELLDRKTAGAQEFFDAMHKGYMADMTGPLIKRAVVGNQRRIITSDSETEITIECDVLYLDNGMHYGASGGPIVNKNGEAVGVIVQRAVTDASQDDVPKINVPSGSTIGLSLQPVEFMCQWQIKRQVSNKAEAAA